jgi:CheY-like chemotaxis protein
MTPANLRILVVSDRRAGRLVTEFLREEGYAAVNAAAFPNGGTPAEADVDLILLDHLSDGFDSFPVYRILRRLDPVRPVLIVVLHMPPDYAELREMVAWALHEANGDPEDATGGPRPARGIGEGA